MSDDKQPELTPELKAQQVLQEALDARMKAAKEEIDAVCQKYNVTIEIQQVPVLRPNPTK